MAACNGGLAPYEQVRDLRILALRAEPPEVQQAAGAALAVRFEALVLDPGGTPVDYVWRFCPIDSDLACRDFEDRIADLPPADAAVLRALAQVAQRGQALAGAHPAEPYAIAPFDFAAAAAARPEGDLSAQLVDIYARQSRFRGGQGVKLSASLSLRNAGGETLVASKRMRFNVRDAASAPAAAPALPAQPPNANPDWTGVDMAQTAEPSAAGAGLDPNQPATVAAGQAVRLHPQLGANAREPYAFLRANLQTRAIEVARDSEDPAVSWFAVHGSLDAPLTWPKFTKTLSNVYTAPSQLPPGAATTLWLVARDGRGGTSWWPVRLALAAPG